MLEIAAQKYGPNSGEYQYASGWKTHVEQDEYYVASFERGDFSSTYYGNLYKPDQNKAWVDKYVRDIYQEGQYSYIVNTDLIQETFTALSGIGSPSADYIKGSVAALKVWYDGKIKLVESQPHSGSNILTIQRVFSGYLSTFTNSNTFAKSLAAGNKISNNSIIAKDTKSKLTIEKKNEIKKQVADNLDVIVKENFEVKSVPEKNGFSKITITVKDQKKYEDSLNKFKVIEKVNNVDLNEVYDK